MSRCRSSYGFFWAANTHGGVRATAGRGRKKRDRVAKLGCEEIAFGIETCFGEKKGQITSKCGKIRKYRLRKSEQRCFK